MLTQVFDVWIKQTIGNGWQTELEQRWIYLAFITVLTVYLSQKERKKRKVRKNKHTLPSLSNLCQMCIALLCIIRDGIYHCYRSKSKHSTAVPPKWLANSFTLFTKKHLMLNLITIYKIKINSHCSYTNNTRKMLFGVLSALSQNTEASYFQAS